MWKVVTDSSLSGDRGHQTESVSAVLQHREEEVSAECLSRLAATGRVIVM